MNSPTQQRTLSVLLAGPGFFDQSNKRRKQLEVELKVQKSDFQIWCGILREPLPFTVENFLKVLDNLSPVGTIINPETVEDTVSVGTMSALKSRKNAQISVFSFQKFSDIINVIKENRKFSVKIYIKKIDQSGSIEKFRTSDFPYSAPKSLIDLSKQLFPQLLTLKQLIMSETGLVELPAGFFKLWALEIASFQCSFPNFSHQLCQMLPQLKFLVLKDTSEYNKPISTVGTIVANSLDSYVKSIIDQIPKTSTTDEQSDPRPEISSETLFFLPKDFEELSNILRAFIGNISAASPYLSSLSLESRMKLEDRFYTSGMFLGYSFHKLSLEKSENLSDSGRKRTLPGLLSPVTKRTRSNPNSIRELVQMSKISENNMIPFRILTPEFQKELGYFAKEAQKMALGPEKVAPQVAQSLTFMVKKLKTRLLELFSGDL